MKHSSRILTLFILPLAGACGSAAETDAGGGADAGPRDAVTTDSGGSGLDASAGDSGVACDPSAESLDLNSAEGLLYTNPRFSPDGTRIAVLAWRGFTLEDIQVLDRCGLVTDRLQLGGSLDPTSTWGPAFSPDGATVYYAGNDDAVHRVAIGGNAPEKVVDLGGFPLFDVSPDGARVVYNGRFNLEVATIDTASAAIDLGVSGASPRWSPDSTRIAYVDGQEIAIIEVATKAVTTIVNVGLGASVAWLPGDSGLVITTDQGVERLQLGTPPVRTVLRSETVARNVDVSADGQTAVYGLNGQKPVRVLRLGAF